MATHERQASNLDGLVQRIEIAHEISPTIGYALMFLFALIEIAPILFKLMLVKGPYDYLEQDRKRMLCAQRGIQLKGEVVVSPDGEASEITVDRYHRADGLLTQERSRIATEVRLAEHGQKVFEAKTKSLMDDDIDGFIVDA